MLYKHSCIYLGVCINTKKKKKYIYILRKEGYLLNKIFIREESSDKTFSVWDRDLTFADSKPTHTGQDSCGYLDMQSPLDFKR